MCLQLREKGYHNPVKGKKKHIAKQREKAWYGLITLSPISAVRNEELAMAWKI